MVERTFTYPLQGSGKFRHVIGGTLIYFSWLVFPLIILIGYYIQALTFASVGREDPPPFGDVRSLLKTGLVGSLITFTYTGIFIATPLIVATYVGNVIMDPSYSSETEFFLDGLLLILGVFATLMSLILPVVLAHYGRTGSFKEAYNTEALVRLLKTREVLKAIAFTIVATIIAAITVLGFITLTLGIGVLFLPFILFWYMLVTACIYGRGIGKATGTFTSVNYHDIVDELNEHDDTIVPGSDDQSSSG